MSVNALGSIVLSVRNRPGTVIGVLAGALFGVLLALLLRQGPHDSRGITVESPPATMPSDGPAQNAPDGNASDGSVRAAVFHQAAGEKTQVHQASAIDTVADGPAEAVGDLGSAASPALPQNTPRLASVADPQASIRQAVTLWNTSPVEFETVLRRALGERLLPPDRIGNTSEYRMPLARKDLRLRVDGSAGRVIIESDEATAQGAVQLIRTLDSAAASADGIRFVAMPQAKPDAIRRLVRAVQAGPQSAPATPRLGPESLAMVVQSAPDSEPQPPQRNTDRTAPQMGFAQAGDPSESSLEPVPRATGVLPEASPTSGNKLVAPVQVEIVEGLDALIIRGRPEDVKRVGDLIRQIEQFSLVMEPTIEIVPLTHVEAATLASLLQELYTQIYAAREGAVSITPLAAPNALLLIGRPESVEKMLGLVERLDQPFEPASRFQVFRLRHVPAETAQTQITQFFEDTDSSAALAPRILAIADFRSNSLIVRASPRDLAEVAAIVTRLDSGQSDAFNEVRVFPLRNSLAETLAPILQDAVTGQMYGQRARTGQVTGMVGAQAQNYERKSIRLRLVTVGEDGRSVLNSGILSDAQVTADARTNSLIVTASADSMPLLAALIRELDQPPSVESQVKVFTLVNGDASNMATMLQSIFGTTGTGAEMAVRTGIVEDDTSLVGLRFAVDVRTNSIIATGSVGALTVVEAVLSRLDEGDVRQRRNEVYRLKNSFAPDVATAVNEYLTSKRQVETSASGLLSAFEQVEREVIVVSEPVSNSLIVSATPKYFDDIARLVEQLDRRPPMAMIQVVIAEVSLSNYDELGVEMGVQDSILFNRALGTGPFALPGSLFTNGSNTGGQAATGFSTGQVNSDLSFGGLVLSASSESVTVLIRALAQCQKVRVLSRPQIMTLDNQPAQVVVGEDVPYITGTTFSEYGQQNSISYREVGLILTVTPRVSPDGLVVMEIVATNSKVGPTEDGIPVSVAGDQVIRSPRIQMISAQTVVSALDGQTVVLGGLIIDDEQAIERRVPYLSDIPIAGNLFKYKSNTKARKELLIIMTPRIVAGVDEARQIAEVESARMTWCLRDVEQLHGGYGPDAYFHGDTQEGPRIVYPHLTPTIDMMQEPPLNPMGPEMVPTPSGVPVSPRMQPRPAPQQAAPIGNGAGGRFSESPFQPEDRFLEQ